MDKRQQQNRSQNRANSILPREIHHGLQIVFNRFQGGGARILCNIVGTCQDYDDMRIQGNDVLPKTEKNLRGGLAADPAVHVGFTLKEN